jgi:uncharacterized protein YxjI
LNSRIKKKKSYKDIITRIYGCNSDVIVLEYKNHSIPFSRLYRIYQNVCKKANDKTIIVLPDALILKDNSKEQLINMRDQMNKIIDSL